MEAGDGEGGRAPRFSAQRPGVLGRPWVSRRLRAHPGSGPRPGPHGGRSGWAAIAPAPARRPAPRAGRGSRAQADGPGFQPTPRARLQASPASSATLAQAQRRAHCQCRSAAPPRAWGCSRFRVDSRGRACRSWPLARKTDLSQASSQPSCRMPRPYRPTRANASSRKDWLIPGAWETRAALPRAAARTSQGANKVVTPRAAARRTPAMRRAPCGDWPRRAKRRCSSRRTR